jgi:copper(I)-binding protein
MNIFAKAALAVILCAGAAQAHEYTVGSLSIDHPMTFETAPSVNVAGGYMAISNTGAQADKLIAVRVATIPRVELHLSETDGNGVARMIKQDSIEVPAGETVMLKPGGLHVMFMGLNGDPFELGEEVPATLVFENAGEVEVVFNVEERSANDHSGMDHSGHKMSD